MSSEMCTRYVPNRGEEYYYRYYRVESTAASCSVSCGAMVGRVGYSFARVALLVYHTHLGNCAG